MLLISNFFLSKKEHTTFGFDCRLVDPRCDKGASTSACSTVQFKASNAFKLSRTGSL